MTSVLPDRTHRAPRWRPYLLMGLAAASVSLLVLAVVMSVWAAKPEGGVYRVVAVFDGDTIQVIQDRRRTTIRLHGIDCPETDGQPFGQSAKKFASGLLFGKDVTIEKKDTDRYHRTVAVVRLEDKTHVNEAIVRAGYAWHYVRYAPKDKALAEAEAAARAAKRGLWTGDDPIPPWDWRRRKRR